MERIIYLSGHTRNPSGRSRTRSGPLQGFLFGLAPDGVFRASAIALGAVGSYPTFSPLPNAADKLRRRAVCFLWHCPSERLATSPPACIPISGDQVKRHRALGCSDFPPPACAGSDPPPFQNQAEPNALFRPAQWQYDAG